MRLTSLVFRTDDGEDVEFSLLEKGFDRYMVRSIVGIDAEELIPKFYGRSLETGKKYYEQTMKPRDVVVRVVLNPRYQTNERVSDIRDDLYRLIARNRTGELQLLFKSGGTVVSSIKGMITKFEAAHFTRTPEVQITVTCPDPMFRSIHPILYEPAELPAANPVSLPDSASTAPHGFRFGVKFTALVLDFIIQDHPTDPEWQFKVSPVGGFIEDDELFISSEFGDKYVWMVRVGPQIDIMDKVSAASVWPQIFPGSNQLYFMNIDDFTWLQMDYYSAYWGV